MFIGNKKCRIYAACGVSQTPKYPLTRNEKTIMSWMDDHYRMDEDGNFETLADYNRAVGNGDLEELSNGHYYDRETNTEYDSRGDKI